MWDTEKICKTIWELEQEHNLLDLKIQGIYVWQLLRYRLFIEISQQKKLFKQPHVLKNTFADKLLAFPRFLKNSILHNPFFSRHPKRVLIFDHPKKTAINGYFREIYTEYLIKQLPDTDV